MTAKVLVVVAGLGLLLCGQTAQAAPVAVIKSLDGTHILCKTLFAGQTDPVGTVCLEVTGDLLLVTYSITAANWSLVQTHFWAGTDIGAMPQNKAGNPVIGKFPYKSPNPLPPGTKSYVQTIPLLNLSFACPTDKDVNYYTAAHAVVAYNDGTTQKTETAWGDGARIKDQGNWGMYFTFTLSCSNNEAQRRCETAFARAVSPDPAICFLELELDGQPGKDFSRWGWTNGPLEMGSYSFQIYAGAGKCDVTKGTLVGTLFVDYGMDGMVTVIYSISNQAAAAGWEIDQLHVYVGNEILPRDVNDEFTVAPGQYTIIKDHVENPIYDVVELGPFSGLIYVVAHATVCTWDFIW